MSVLGRLRFIYPRLVREGTAPEEVVEEGVDWRELSLFIFLGGVFSIFLIFVMNFKVGREKF